MKAGVFLLVAAVGLPGCAPMAEVEANAPPAAAPQPLLPEGYSAPPTEAVASAAPSRPVISPPQPTPTFAAALAREGPGVPFPGVTFNPYHPHWIIDVQ